MKKIFYIIIPFLTILGCESIDFDDPSTLTNQEASEKIKSLGYVLTKSSIQNVFMTSTSNAGGSHFSLWADQSTNTNGSQSWWDFANEPRLRFNNNSAYRGEAAVVKLFSNYYQANLDATKVIDLIENQGRIIYDDNDNDRTTDCLIGAYYAKGISQGSLGAVFDRGLIVDDVNVANKELPHSYQELIENGIKHLDKALQLIDASPNAKFDFLTGIVISNDDLKKLINSFAARLLASIARDKAEAEKLDATVWQRVYDYADKGFTSDFLITTVSGGYFNELIQTLELPSLGAYVPADIKVAYLADKNRVTPTEYPVDNTVLLDAIETDDARFYQYFVYTTSFGNLMEGRGRHLFSNYKRARWMQPARSSLNVPGAINPYFLAEEVRLLKAEALYWLGDLQGTADLLNDGSASRIAKGNLPQVNVDEDEIIDVLHYEYSIEVDGGGGTFLPFTFMRRHDLLQAGTPTQFPVPQVQLELIGIKTYTFGGFDNQGEKGIFGETATAKGKGWKK